MTKIDNLMSLADNYATLTADTAAVTKAREALRTALTEALAAQPVREPQCVAKITVYDNHCKLEYLSLPVGTHKLYAQQYSYSAPSESQPVREPLSDEQIRNLSDLPECMYGDYLQSFPFARAVERAHHIGVKNEEN